MIKFLRETSQLFRIIRKNPRNSGVILLLDLCFIATFLILQNLFGLLAASISISNFGSAVFVFASMSALYYAVLITVYSFFKLNVISCCSNLYGKPKNNSDKLLKFIMLNFLIALIFFGIMLFFNFILSGIKPNAQIGIFFAVAPFYLIYLYVSIQASHSYFLKDPNSVNALKKGLSFIFSNFRKLNNVFCFSLLCILSSALMFLIAGYGLQAVYSGNNLGYLSAYSNFRNISAIYLYLMLYFMNFINRIYFLQAAEK